MKKKLFAMLLLCLCLCFSFSGCNFTLKAVDKMMHPPALSGENAGIQKAFEKAVNDKNIVMKTPTTGDYRSSFILYDFDGDGEDEAIALYSYSTDETAVYLHFLDCRGGEWLSIADIKGSGSEVYKIDFCDMNSDGRSEIVVCWSLYESRGNKIMTVYEPDSSSGTFVLRSILTENYSQSITCDIDTDGKAEIFNVIISSSSDINKTYGRLFKMDDSGSIYLAGETEMTPAVSISLLKCETGSNPHIFVDSVISDSAVITDVIGLSDGKPVSLLTSGNSSDSPATERSSKLSFADIDKDGRFEIPVSLPLPNSYSVSGDDTEPLSLTVWYGLDNGALYEKSERLMLYSSSYMFSFDKKWVGTVCVKNDIQERTSTFYLYDSTAQKNGAELFSVVTVPSTDWQHKPKDGYTVIFQTSTLTYEARITEAGKNMKITEEYIREHSNAIECPEVKMKKVLIAEDEASIREFIVINLKRSGYDVVEAENGEEAINKYKEENGNIDVAVLDIMMPLKDGLEVCKYLRAKSSKIGIIMLTAKTQEMDKVTGLLVGADDYVTKPFSPSELMARVDAVYRRVSIMNENEKAAVANPDLTTVGDFSLDYRDRILYKNGSPIELTQIEFQLLDYLFKNPDVTLSRSDILNKVWGDGYFVDDKVVDVNIHRLRNKVEDEPTQPKHLITIWGRGYKWIE